MSNLAPATIHGWDPDRNTSWGDLNVSSDGIIFNLKWSKTRQHADHTAAIPLPALGDSLLCPLSAWSQYVYALSDCQLPSPTPLLISTAPQTGAPITIPQFRATFHRLTVLAGLGHIGYTPHSLRRGGATFSFQVGVKIPHIKTHGTWLSNAVDSYLLAQPKFDTPVAVAFTTHHPSHQFQTINVTLFPTVWRIPYYGIYLS